jgi:hypothetical protein
VAGLSYNLFFNSAFALSFGRFVGKKHGRYGVAAIRIGLSELNIVSFCMLVILGAHQHKAHFSPQALANARLREVYQKQDQLTMGQAKAPAEVSAQPGLAGLSGFKRTEAIDGV